MNGEQLPLLNGFPVRLVVPGWYSDYWIKMLSNIEVLDAPDQSYFEAVGYRVPDTPHASVKPGETGFKTVAVTRLVPRSFFTNVTDATIVKPGAAVPVRGIAFGGDSGVSRVELSADGGRNWRQTALGGDEGTYSFRQWSTQITAPRSGSLTLQVRCTNTKGGVQPAEPNWNGGGFMRNVIESEAANAWLPEFVEAHNKRFGRAPANAKNLPRPLTEADDLDEILAWREERTVTRNLTLRYDRMMLLLDPTPFARGLAGKKIEVVNYPDGLCCPTRRCCAAVPGVRTNPDGGARRDRREQAARRSAGVRAGTASVVSAKP